jgi:prophage antirepressor-like protein
MNKIADKMNSLGIPFKNGLPFRSWNINQILKNEVYIGMIVFNKRKSKPSTDPNVKRKSAKRPVEEIIYAPGKHEPIINKEVFERAREKMKSKEVPSLKKQRPLQNPLSGILKCGVCGKTMSRNCTKSNKEYIRCLTYGCTNKGTSLERVEREVIKHMETLMNQHKIKLKQKKEKNFDEEKKILRMVLKEWNDLCRQKEVLHDLLEKGVYSVEMYLERSQKLAERIKEKELSIEKMNQEIEQKEMEQKTRKEFIPALINVMKLYHKTLSIEKKNQLLKTILHKVVYTKNDPTPNGFFELALYPKLPSIEVI